MRILKQDLRISYALKKISFRIYSSIIVTIIVALCLLMFSKPPIESTYHANYLANLEALDDLSDVLGRDYLLVRYGQVRHYDYLESNLQNMEKAAQLSAIVPAHVGPEVAIAASQLSEDYLSELESIRNYIELSKRSIGLLRTSNSSLPFLLDQLKRELADNVDSSAKPQELIIALDLIISIQKSKNISQIHKIIDELAKFDNTSHDLLRQIRLRTGMVSSYSQPLEEATTYILEHVDALNQPGKIRELYLNKHTIVLNRSMWKLITICSLVVSLFVLFGIHALQKPRNPFKERNGKNSADYCANDSSHDYSKAA